MFGGLGSVRKACDKLKQNPLVSMLFPLSGAPVAVLFTTSPVAFRQSCKEECRLCYYKSTMHYILQHASFLSQANLLSNVLSPEKKKEVRQEKAGEGRQ